MKRIFTAVAAIIVTHFAIKAYRKITEEPDTSDLKREVDRKRQEWERRQRRVPPPPTDLAPLEQDLMCAELRRYDGPKVAAEGCAIGSCNGR